MLETTPEYVSANLRNLAGMAPTARAAEAISHRRNARRHKLSQFVAYISRATRFGKQSNETKVAPKGPRLAI